MRAFLREYWAWIVVPFALVLVLLALAYVFLDDGGASPFVYNVGG